MDQPERYASTNRVELYEAMAGQEMNTKEKLLAKLAQRLDKHSSQEARRDSALARLSEHPFHTIPARGRVGKHELASLFEKMLVNVHGTVSRVSRYADLPGAVYDYLHLHQLGTQICVADEVLELGLDWSLSPGLSVAQWQAKQSISVGITGCYGAVAETGSLVVCSSTKHAITMNFLSETNIVILRASDIVGVYEEIWTKISRENAAGMPRDLTLISSPSCTGDIEMVLEYGAHGPRHLHVIIVG